ncbi:MAG: hypothetical protein KF891_01445 [Rhizobacter sp.]|nr:hypothetical protein [Rhizobacter sp.]
MRRALLHRLRRRCSAAVTATIVSAPCLAGTLTPLADNELSTVSGADGLAFNLRGFSLSGPLTLTYTMPGPAGQAGKTLWLSNLALSRSDDPAATFSDPYHLDIFSRPGLADVISLREPANVDGLLKWQFAADWGVNADGLDFQGGALVVQDLVTRGGSLTLTTPANPNVQGIAFGAAVQVDIGNLLLRPRGRDDTTVADPASVTEQWRLAGVHLGAASADGTPLGAPWALADATTQPGILNAVTDANGNSTLHIGIDWPTSGNNAAIGGLVIDNIAFKSASLPGGALDLGSSRIGTMQVQYLDMKLRPGF